MFEEVVGSTDLLIEMAGDSGGYVFSISGQRSATGMSGWSSWDVHYNYSSLTREKVKLFTQALNIQVNGFYTVQVGAPVVHHKANKVSLEIVDGTGKPRKDVSFTYQRALVDGN